MSPPRVFTSKFLLAVYVVSLLLVCSFVLFEVLDVDGSDFPVPVSRAVTSVKAVEPPHDLKRLHTRPASIVEGAAAALGAGDIAVRDPSRIAMRPRVRPVRAHAVVGLARSSLDVPPA